MIECTGRLAALGRRQDRINILEARARQLKVVGERRFQFWTSAVVNGENQREL